MNQESPEIKFLKKALQQAKLAKKHNEVPIGAVLVNQDGKILARGYNKIEKLGCQTAHAEVIAISRACKKLGNWRLENCTLYVTVAPCLMCFGLSRLSRINSIIYAAKSPNFGFDQKEVFYDKKITTKQICENGLEKKSLELIQGFFKQARKSQIL